MKPIMELIWCICGCKCEVLLKVNYVMICEKVEILIKKSPIKFMIILFIPIERTYNLDFGMSRVYMYCIIQCGCASVIEFWV